MVSGLMDKSPNFTTAERFLWDVVDVFRMKAAIYLRTSTSKPEQEHGAEAQEGACRKFLAEQGVDVEGDILVYREMASGRKGADRRPDLRRLLHDAAMKKFRLLVVFRFDRLSRRELLVAGDVVDLIKKLQGYGVQVYSATETWWDPASPAAPLVLAALSWAASMESRAIADRITAGVVARKAEAAKAGTPFVWGRARTSPLTLRCRKCGKPARRIGPDIVHMEPKAAQACPWGAVVRETEGDPELPRRILERRAAGESWGQISRALELPVGTVRAYHRLVAAAATGETTHKAENVPVPAGPAKGAS